MRRGNRVYEGDGLRFPDDAFPHVPVHHHP